MSRILNRGAAMVCPHCQADQDDDPVEDYVVPGYVGADSRATGDCVECFEYFTVEALADGTFEVSKA
jgi:hypothetical protein